MVSGRVIRSMLGALVVVGLASLSTGAAATVDGGEGAHLLAFAGEAQRYAVIVERSVQESCGYVPCTVYAIDTQAKEFQRLWPLVLPVREDPPLEDEQWVLTAYLAKVPAAGRKALAKAQLRAQDSDNVPAIQRSGATSPVWEVNGRRVQARLRELWTFDSMAANDRAIDGASCLPQDAGAVCSTCSAVTRWSDGRKVSAYACKPGKGKLKSSGKVRACDCHARGAAVALELEELGTGRVSQGRKALVEPYQVIQNMGMGSGFEGRALELGTNQPFVRAVVNSAGALIVVGEAGNEPGANATWYPVVAVMPAAAEVAPPPTTK